MAAAQHWRRDGKAGPPPAGARRADGFDFTLHMHRLCSDMVARLEPLRHIRMKRVALSFAQARKATAYGMHASLTPLRFAGGRMHTIRRGRKWGLQRVYAPDGSEYLYILTFYLPRFLDQPLRDKLNTVVHELWHISPRFDGDTRRLGGRCHVHGRSQSEYDAEVARLVDRWLARDPPEPLYGFLRLSFDQLVARYGKVFGQKIPAPKLTRVD
jgi:predicted metallopeptidase